MLEALALLLAFQLLGEALAHLRRSPLPGPVIRMALLLRASQVNAVAGTFAGMAMACSTVITASLVPLLARALLD